MKKCLILLMLAVTVLPLIAGQNSLEIRTKHPGVSVYLNDAYRGRTEVYGDINILRFDGLTPRHRLS